MELSRFLIVWVTFAGLGYAAGKGRHIRMTALVDAMKPSARKAVMLVVTAGTSILLFALTWFALRYVLGTVRELGSVSPVLRVPRYLVYLAAPLGLFLGALQYALAFFKNLLSPEIYLSFDVLDEHIELPTGRSPAGPEDA
jgi:TRAP-type C4-dicarboxylate transport system permease small subunit